VSIATIAVRKHRELEVKLGCLDDELAAWEALAAPGATMEKHHSQMARLAAHMRGLQRELAAELAAARKSGTVLGGSVELERTILQAHRVWDFFRRKFALRCVEHFRPWLAAADELAWACYEPALRRRRRSGAVDPRALREPPLVYLYDDVDSASPMEYSRQKAVDLAELPVVPRERFLAILRELPIPLVGVPWFQLAHLPEMTLIAHEVGHIVEDDLGLAKRLHELVGAALARAKVPAPRREAWDAWLGEIFADVWGVLALGPAFAWSLQTFIADAPIKVAAERRDAATGWGAYPTTWLRAALAAESVERTGHAAAATAVRKAWLVEFPVHAMTAYAGGEPTSQGPSGSFVPGVPGVPGGPSETSDIALVVGAILDGPWPEFGGGPLADTLAFDVKRQKNAAALAAHLLSHHSVEDGKAADVRVLVAAAALAVVDDPRAFEEGDRATALLEAIETSITAGVRGEPGAVDPTVEAAHAATIAAWDDAAGGRLRALLKGA
jgi:hypothetical protein